MVQHTMYVFIRDREGKRQLLMMEGVKVLLELLNKQVMVL